MENVVFLEVLQKINNKDFVTSQIKTAQSNNKQSRIYPFVDRIRT